MDKKIKLILLLLVTLIFLHPPFYFNNQKPTNINQKIENNVLNTLDATSTNNILILINSTLYSNISNELGLFVDDIKLGLLTNATIYIYPETWNFTSIKNYIQNVYSVYGLRGCIFIGNIPAFYYEHIYKNEYSRFAWDYYYMDLDTNFIDTDYNQTPDTMIGNIGPEIWVSRIDTTGMPNEIELYKNFFKRNHLIRNVGSRGIQRGLLWVDDTWAGHPWSYQIDKCLGELYPLVNRTLKNSTAMTTKTNYLNTDLPADYEWLWTNIHSNTTNHNIEEPGPIYNSVSWEEINQTSKNAEFYILYCCGAGNFTTPNCLAEWYIFGNTNGQISISCARDGGFWYGTHDYYKDLVNGDSIGEAWKKMYQRGYKNSPYTDGFREPFPDPINWMGHNYYWKNYTEGTNLFGDPTLQNCRKQIKITITDNVVYKSCFNDRRPSIYITDCDDWGLYNVTLLLEIMDNGTWNMIDIINTDLEGKVGLNLTRNEYSIRITYNGTPNYSSNQSIFNIKVVDIRPLEIIIIIFFLDQQNTMKAIINMPVSILVISLCSVILILIYPMKKLIKKSKYMKNI